MHRVRKLPAEFQPACQAEISLKGSAKSCSWFRIRIKNRDFVSESIEDPISKEMIRTAHCFLCESSTGKSLSKSGDWSSIVIQNKTKYEKSMKSLGDKDRGRENRQQKKLTLTLCVDKRNNKKVIAYESEHDVVKQRKPIVIQSPNPVFITESSSIRHLPSNPLLPTFSRSLSRTTAQTLCSLTVLFMYP